MKTVLSIGDRETRKEVLILKEKCKVSDLRKRAMAIAHAAGYYDLLRYSIWVGSEAAYKIYRAS